jgi:hypothetical protein
MAYVTDSFTRPSDTDAYQANDLIANDVDAGDVDPLEFAIGTGNGRGIRIVGARLQKSDGTDVANSAITLHLFASEPTVANGDNGALSTDTANKIGTIVFPTMTAYTDDALAVVHACAVTGGINPLFTYLRSTSTIYGLLMATAAYSPASAEVFTVSLIIEQY